MLRNILPCYLWEQLRIKTAMIPHAEKIVVLLSARHKSSFSGFALVFFKYANSRKLMTRFVKVTNNKPKATLNRPHDSINYCTIKGRLAIHCKFIAQGRPFSKHSISKSWTLTTLSSGNVCICRLVGRQLSSKVHDRYSKRLHQILRITLRLGRNR